MRLAMWARVVAAAGAIGAAGANEVRTPAAAEQKAFEAWYRARSAAASAGSVRTAASLGGAASVAPALQVRGEGKRRVLSAHEDATAVRAVLPLCRTQRTIFERGAKTWSERTETWAWIHHSPQCGAAPAAAFHLRTELPEIDILRLVQAQATLLNSARLLMAGNTGCSPTRSRHFRLIALDKAKDGMPALVFESDIGSTATVAIRKSRADLTAWNVNCQ